MEASRHSSQNQYGIGLESFDPPFKINGKFLEESLRDPFQNQKRLAWGALGHFHEESFRNSLQKQKEIGLDISGRISMWRRFKIPFKVDQKSFWDLHVKPSRNPLQNH